jgi:hypothetical protein
LSANPRDRTLDKQRRSHPRDRIQSPSSGVPIECASCRGTPSSSPPRAKRASAAATLVSSRATSGAPRVRHPARWCACSVPRAVRSAGRCNSSRSRDQAPHGRRGRGAAGRFPACPHHGGTALPRRDRTGREPRCAWCTARATGCRP